MFRIESCVLMLAVPFRLQCNNININFDDINSEIYIGIVTLYTESDYKQ
jgi:hypothetical protein